MFSKKEPHGVSRLAEENVEALQAKLLKVPARGATHGYLGRMQGVPQRSLAMLVCKVQLPSDEAVKFYPSRPPMSSPKAHNVQYADTVLPAFLIHFT
jgi:hypothetical protein